MATENKEIKALSEVVEALDTLDEGEVFRVIEYIVKKYIVSMKKHKRAELEASKNLVKELEQSIKKQALSETNE